MAKRKPEEQEARRPRFVVVGRSDVKEKLRPASLTKRDGGGDNVRRVYPTRREAEADAVRANKRRGTKVRVVEE